MTSLCGHFREIVVGNLNEKVRHTYFHASLIPSSNFLKHLFSRSRQVSFSADRLTFYSRLLTNFPDYQVKGAQYYYSAARSRFFPPMSN